jgi:hypothetical protein
MEGKPGCGRQDERPADDERLPGTDGRREFLARLNWGWL